MIPAASSGELNPVELKCCLFVAWITGDYYPLSAERADFFTLVNPINKCYARGRIDRHTVLRELKCEKAAAGRPNSVHHVRDGYVAHLSHGCGQLVHILHVDRNRRQPLYDDTPGFGLMHFPHPV